MSAHFWETTVLVRIWREPSVRAVPDPISGRETEKNAEANRVDLLLWLVGRRNRDRQKWIAGPWVHSRVVLGRGLQTRSSRYAC